MTKEQIKEGLDKAYKEAGHNAYFGNGFEAGVKFALDAQKTAQNSDYVKLPNMKQIFEAYPKLMIDDIVDVLDAIKELTHCA